MNKMRKFDVMDQGDPDLQPIRSFENATLVRLLYHFCNFINTQVGGSFICDRVDKCFTLYHLLRLIAYICYIYSTVKIFRAFVIGMTW